MKCQHVQEKMEQYIDNELRQSDRRAVEEHVAKCTACAAELANLQAINATGKMDVFPEPEPEYWNSMKQSVMGRIGEMEKQPARSALWLEKISAIVWPDQVRFRLVSLATSAALLFFFVHFAFFKQGKFEIPASTVQMEIKEQAEEEIQSKQKSEHPTFVPAKEEFLQKDDSKSMRTASEKDKSENQIPATPMKKEKEIPIQVTNAPTASGKGAIVQPAAPAPKQIMAQDEQAMADAIQPATTEKSGKFEAISKGQKESAREKFETRMVQPAVMEKRSSDKNVSVLRARSSDETIFDVEFEKAKYQAGQVKQFVEKILIWEKFLEKNPPLTYQKKAIREQLQLHFEQAVNSNEKKSYEQSIDFYETKIEIFKGDADFEVLMKELNQLKENLKKIEKN